MGILEWLGAGGAQAAPALPPAAKLFEGADLALLNAALAGDMAAARAALQQGARPNGQGPKSASKATPQLTLLSYAFGARQREAARMLIELGADPGFQPRKEDGDTVIFLVVRGDSEMLDALYALWPLSRFTVRQQQIHSDAGLMFSQRKCLEVMFKHGLPKGITDSVGEGLFLNALAAEKFDYAEWLLTEVGVPLDQVSRIGTTPANGVQFALERFRPGSKPHDSLLKLKTFMEAQGVVFPVPTPADMRQRAKAVK